MTTTGLQQVLREHQDTAKFEQPQLTDALLHDNTTTITGLQLLQRQRQDTASMFNYNSPLLCSYQLQLSKDATNVTS